MCVDCGGAAAGAEGAGWTEAAVMLIRRSWCSDTGHKVQQRLLVGAAHAQDAAWANRLLLWPCSLAHSTPQLWRIIL